MTWREAYARVQKNFYMIRQFSLSLLVVASLGGHLGLAAYSAESDICALNSPYGMEDKNVEYCKASIQRGVRLNGALGDLATYAIRGKNRIQVWVSPEAGKDPISQGGCWPNVHEPNKRCQVMIKTSAGEPFYKAESYLNSMNCRTPVKRTTCITFLGLEGRYSGAKVLTWGYNLEENE